MKRLLVLLVLAGCEVDGPSELERVEMHLGGATCERLVYSYNRYRCYSPGVVLECIARGTRIVCGPTATTDAEVK